VYVTSALGHTLDVVCALVPPGVRVAGFKEFTRERLKKKAQSLGLSVVHGGGGTNPRKRDFVDALCRRMPAGHPWLDMTHF
jgi:hypothetical protein